MKTTLPTEINTVLEAETFLTELYNNGESYHPEDSAHDIGSWNNKSEFVCMFTPAEADQLNILFENIYNLDGNNGNHATHKFDPCAFILNLDPEYVSMCNMWENKQD